MPWIFQNKKERNKNKEIEKQAREARQQAYEDAYREAKINQAIEQGKRKAQHDALPFTERAKRNVEGFAKGMDRFARGLDQVAREMSDNAPRIDTRDMPLMDERAIFGEEYPFRRRKKR